MHAALVLLGCVASLAVTAWVLVFILGHLSYPRAHVGIGERRGGLMGTIARWVVLGLGHLTFAVLHLFEKLGVDMANIDEVLANWTSWSQDIKGQLASALETIQQLKDTDAAEDAAQAEALTAEIEAKVQAAYDAATSTPTPPSAEEPVVEPEPEAPVEEEPVDAEVVDLDNTEGESSGQ